MIFLRVITFIWALFIAWMMALQFDDSDAAVWVAVYGSAAALCLLASVGVRVALPAGFAMICCLGWSVWLSPNVLKWLGDHSFGFIVDDASVHLDYMEQSRESLGLFIAALGLALAWFVTRRRKRKGLL